MDGAALREILGLASASCLFIGMLIDEHDGKSAGALNDVKPSHEREQDMLERAKYHLRRRSARGYAGLCLKVFGGAFLAAATASLALSVAR
ncbi:MAG: hypothetical protein KDA46_00620 [Parvularculaceae bacterium]|nr:hypothetical protein [Parvularculaceae bacterium]